MKKLFAFFWSKSLLLFLLFGLANTVVSTVGSQLLYPALGYWGSTALMFALCSVASFWFNRKYSFESKAPLGQSIFRFAVVIAVCYLFAFSVAKPLTALVCGGLFAGLSHTTMERLSMLVAQCFFTACNYLGQRLWAFKA